MKIQDLATNDSSFIELNLNEAADVCGGSPGWSPMEFHYNLEEEFGTSSFSTYYARQYPNRYTQTQPSYRSLDDANRGMRNVDATLTILRNNGISI